MRGGCTCTVRWLGLVALTTTMLAGPGWGQQPYVNNHQLDCANPEYDSVTKGFVCNGAPSSCQAYITFRAQPPYTSPATIGYLLGAQDSAPFVASINNISDDMASIPINTLVIVPVNCSCFNGTYSQHNASYTLKYDFETYLTVANDNYQGLSTCQAMHSQNPYGVGDLSVGMNLRVPLRCACPTSNQSSLLGVKYLLSYMVSWEDDVPSIANTFGVDQQAVLDANELSSESLIFPFTPILVPLTSPPSKIQLSPLPAPSPQMPRILVSAPKSSSNDYKWVYNWVGIGFAVLVILLLLMFGYCFCYRKSRKSPSEVALISLKLGNESSSANYGAIPVSSNSLSLSPHGHAIESLTVYRFDDLLLATGNFEEDKRIKGTSVYRANFKGDGAAVKVMKGDVSAEIKLLKMINHSNIIRLSGFCVCEGNTYLVYEYADNGSLYDCLHEHKDKVDTDQHLLLSWKQRVQIAYDVVDALNYLHNYTNPPYIHKNLNTTNILLDPNFRAKVSNFGLARTLQDQNSGMQLQLTRHVVGTQGYMAPEYIENGVITTKMDVFAYGVILLELLSGREAVSFGPDKNEGGDDLLSASIIRVLEGDNVRQKLHDFIDPSLRDEYPLDLAFSMGELAKSCVAHDLNARPSISQAFMTLSKILSSSLDWDHSSELQHSSNQGHS